MAEPIAFPLPISYGQTDAVRNSGGYLINLEAEVAPKDARTPVTLRGAPGLSLFCDISDFPVVDGVVINDRCYVATKNGIYRIFPDGGSFKLGTIAIGALGRASTNGLAFVVVDGLRTWAYTFNDAEQSWYDNGVPFVDYAVEITANPFQYPSRTVAFLDSMLFYNREGTGQFFNTEPLSLTVAAANFKTAESAPDNVVAVFVDHQILMVAGRTTTEFYYNTGVGASPVQRVPGGVVEHGCASPYAIAKTSNNTFILSPEGVVYAYQGYTPRPVSTPAIEAEIKKRDPSTGTALCYIDAGHFYYQLSLAGVGDEVPAITLVYDLSTNLWHQRKDREFGRHRASCYMLAFGKHLVGDFQSGKIYEMSTEFYDNDGDAMIAEIVTGPIQTAGRYAAHASVELELDVGTGNADSVNPQIGMEVSDDDGVTFGNQRLRPVGKVGKHRTRVRWKRNGSSRNRRYRFVISDPVPRFFTSQVWLEVT